MPEIMVPLAIGAIRVLNYIYELVAWPIHLIWRDRRTQPAIMARPAREGEPGSAWRNLESMDELTTSMFPGCVTLDDVWNRSLKLWPEKKALGTREVIAKHVEVQANGREFLKLELGNYQWETFAELDRRIENFGLGLLALGHLKSGGEDRVVFYAETRAEWMIAVQACLRFSLPVVTLYATLGDDALMHGIIEAEAKVVITSDELLPKLVKVLNGRNDHRVKHVIFMNNAVFEGTSTPEEFLTSALPTGSPPGISVVDMQSVEKHGKASSGTRGERKKVRVEDIALIMYTSGSTGIPKGVVMTHGNLMSALAGMHHCLPLFRTASDIYVAYLPMAHVLELCCEIYCLSQGVCVGYSSPQTLLDSGTRLYTGIRGDVIRLRPTLMTCVPTILDRLSKTVWEKVGEGGPFARSLFKWSYHHKEKRLMAGYRTPFLDRLLFGRIRGILGGRVRYMLCGGAPLSHEAQQFVYVCFAKIVQGYGLTETVGAGTLTAPGDLRTEQAGRPLTCLEIKLRPWDEGNYRPSDRPCPRGEIMIGGGCVSQGYFKQPEKTAEDFFVDDKGQRWFCSGDIGMFEADGRLKIIDRKKDLVKLQAGEYVSLGKVELALSTCPLVELVCIYGDARREVAVALIVPKKKALSQLAASLNIPNLPALTTSSTAEEQTEIHETLCRSDKVKQAVLKELQKLGLAKGLHRFELPGHVYLHPEAWTPDTGLVTDAFKLKRRAIQDRFQENIDHMYCPNGDIDGP